MIPDIKEINLPEYATLTSATVTINNMGESTIDATVSIDRNVTPDFSYDWEIEFRGARYIHPLREPQATKENTKFNPTYQLVFQHKAIYELKRYFFMEMASVDDTEGVIIADKYIASLSVTLPDFKDAFNKVLRYYFGDRIRMELRKDPEHCDPTPTTISISYSKIWDVLTSIYENYGVMWNIVNEDGVYIINVGDDLLTPIDHVFSYGFEGGLLKVERQVQDPDIRNILLGRGGDRNLPYRYFKDRAVDSGGGGLEHTFPPDPDWIPELANIYFDGLRDINFRYYIQGWKDRGGARRYDEGEYWAYDKGYTATKFDPIEYVKDDASISKYGELWGGLETIEDIYPSIQGVVRPNLGRVDQTVAVEQITPDYEEYQKSIPSVIQDRISGMMWNDGIAVIRPSDIPNVYTSSFEYTSEGHTYKSESDQGRNSGKFLKEVTFTVNEGYKANLYIEDYDKRAIKKSRSGGDRVDMDVSSMLTLVDGNFMYSVVNVETGEELPPTDIPPGTYYYRIKGQYNLGYPLELSDFVYISFSVDKITLVQDILDDTRTNLNTFDIWIKNLWETQKLPTESDKEYSRRVWQPILGDRTGNEAKVIFSSGLLSFNEDYEFIISRYPVYDTSKTLRYKLEDDTEVDVSSHWRVTLRRSDAELKTIGEYLPNPTHNAVNGEYFFFVGIDMPHQYVVWAEERLNAYKRQQLVDTSKINPKWAITLDKVRAVKTNADLSSLMDKLNVGRKITLSSKWFVSGGVQLTEGQEQFYTTIIQSLVFTYKQPADKSPCFIPDVTITLSDKPSQNKTTIGLLQGTVDVLTNRVNSMSMPYIDIIKTTDNDVTPTDSRVYSAQRVKQCYVDKTQDDETSGLLKSAKGFTIGDFVVGSSGAGTIIQDDGTTYEEVDVLRVRKKAFFEEIDIVKVQSIGGKQIVSPGGSVTFSDVIETSEGFICMVKTNEGETETQIKIVEDDLILFQTLNVIKGEKRYYWRRCIGVGKDFIILSKTDYDRSVPNDIPQVDDVVVQLGHKGNDTLRQNAIVISTVDNNSPNITLYRGIDDYSLTNLETIDMGVSDTGIPYQHIYGDAYIGPKDRSTYVEYDSTQKELNIKAKISVESSIGDTNINKYFQTIINDEFADDGKLTTAEKRQILTLLLEIRQEFDSYSDKAKSLDVDISDYEDAFYVLLFYLTGETKEPAYLLLENGARLLLENGGGIQLSFKGVLSDMDKASEIDREQFLELFRNYYTERDNAQLNKGLSGDYTQTVIDGGVVTTGTIELKGGDGVTKAGITGHKSDVEDDGTDIRIWAGAEYASRDSAPFRVNQNGEMWATNAHVQGVITAESLILSEKSGLMVTGTMDVVLPVLSNGTFRTIDVWLLVLSHNGPSLRMMTANDNVYIGENLMPAHINSGSDSSHCYHKYVVTVLGLYKLIGYGFNDATYWSIVKIGDGNTYGEEFDGDIENPIYL